MTGPSSVYLLLRTGEFVDCLLEEIAPNAWQATPVRDVDIEEVVYCHVDELPGGATLALLLGKP